MVANDIENSPAHRQTRRRVATTDRLLAAARELMAEAGLQATTVERITERAGFTRGAFYSNYDSTDDLILDMFRRERDFMLERVALAIDSEIQPGSDPDDVSTILRGIDHFFEVHPTDRNWFLIHQEFISHSVRQREIAAVYEDIWNQTQTELCALIDKAASTLGRRFTIPTSEVASLVMAAFEEAMKRWFVSSQADEFDPSTLRATLTTLVLALSEADPR